MVNIIHKAPSEIMSIDVIEIFVTFCSHDD
jgi:hypothetical protein